MSSASGSKKGKSQAIKNFLQKTHLRVWGATGGLGSAKKKGQQASGKSGFTFEMGRFVRGPFEEDPAVIT